MFSKPFKILFINILKPLKGVYQGLYQVIATRSLIKLDKKIYMKIPYYIDIQK
jgi:hypothetical protein